jgi:nitrogen fixation protein FixH
MAQEVNEKGKFTGRKMLFSMLAFFGVIITVNLTMATFASRSWTGLVVKNTYVESQKFNGKLEQARKQASLGLSGSLSQNTDGVGFVLQNKFGDTISVNDVRVVFRRPATEVMDQKITFAAQGKGRYAGIVKLDAGAWTAEVNAQLPDKTPWLMNYDLFVKKDGSFPSVSNKIE